MADVIPVKRYSTGLAELQSGDTINWSWLSGIPAYATRWPAWGEVTGKPTTLAGYGITDAAPASHVGAGGTAHAAATTSEAGFMSAADKTKLNGIASGATANTGTVTSVELSAPTGLSVSGSPITTSGTLALSWESGYQGYTTDEAIKLSGIEAGATAGADSWNSPINLTVGRQTNSLDGSSDVTFTPIQMGLATTATIQASPSYTDLAALQADLAANSSFVGSGLVASSWKCGISARHQGGRTTDSSKYGLFIFDDSMTSYATVGNIKVQKQVNGSWQDPQTIAFDSQVVHLSGNETITGTKTFTGSAVRIVSNAPGFWLNEEDGSHSVYVVLDGSNFQFQRRNAGWGAYVSQLFGINTALGESYISYNFRPTSNNSYSLGTPSNLWTQLYATNSTINTSDARLKTEPRALSDAELAAFGAIGRLPCVWQWLERVETEGEDARLHSGPTVQAAMAIMTANGLDWSRYSAFCYDTWEASRGDVLADGEEWDGETETAEEADTDPDTGETITVTRTYKVNPAGDRYSFRKEELLWWCMRALFAEHDALAARVAALETA